MQTIDHQQYAWVWWNADGSVNYKKGVLGFSVGGLQIESVDSGNGPYKVFIPKEGYTVVIDAEYFGGISPLSPFRSPVTTSEIDTYDSEALRLLDANMKRADL
ncbi:MAG TPA: hypothetical protein VFH06_04055 [Candidatus Saccharimonadales bacterium]|nr:hypothetical protein [Candidatus Saccharimonadales bacterium]